MEYITIGSNAAITLADFKTYAKISGTADDAQLTKVLQNATLRVQEYADKALLPCTIEIDGEGEKAQLWQPVISTVVSVTDWATGENVIDRCLARSNTLFLPRKMHYTIRYTTSPQDSEVARLLPYVWEAAAAIWDGNTEEESAVYKRIPASYVVQ